MSDLLQPGVELTLTPDQIERLCRRAFGDSIAVESARDLHGGTFNTSYLITLRDRPPIILRIAPRSDSLHWDEAFLMRREHAVQPFFAPVASLMPKTILIDFTHQLIERDYMFQTYIDGDRWDHIQDQLTAKEEDDLWAQFGSLLKQIHAVQGEAFGLPSLPFQKWSEYVLDRLDKLEHDLSAYDLDVGTFDIILNQVRANHSLLDEVKRPFLLHGDLWLFNILVKRTADRFKIVGILDADRASWGDPLADWTMFILANAPYLPEVKHAHSIFWEAYGQPDATPGLAFRQQVYQAMHAAGVLRWGKMHDDSPLIHQAQEKITSVAAGLPTTLTGL